MTSRVSRKRDRKGPPNSGTAHRTSTIPPRLLRRLQAAAYLNISPSALDILRARRDVVAVRVPALRRQGEIMRCPLFDVRDLDAVIERWKSDAVE
jgi:hypothetical protein